MAEIVEVPLSHIRPVLDSSLIARSDGVFLITSPRKWAYGAEAQFAIPGIEMAARTVQVTMAVESGVLGVGWLQNDELNWVTRASATPSPEFQNITLLIPAGTPEGKLVFDNWSEDGTPARGVIRHIEVSNANNETGDMARPSSWQAPSASSLKDLDYAEVARIRSDIRRIFRISHRHHVPSGKTIEELEKAFKLFSSVDEILELIAPNPVVQNLAKNIWEFATAKTVLTSYPWNVSIPVADLCNARCTFCTSWLDGRKVLDLDKLDMFEPVLKHALLIGLVGHGEPLAHPRFDELCDRLEVICDPVSTIYTITNGFFLEKWRDRLDRINLHSYSISLNAATPETHDTVMGLGRDAFPRIVESISHLIELGRTPGNEKQVFITLVVTQQNLSEIPAFIELGNRLGVTEIWLRSLLPQGNLVPGLNYHLLPPYLHPDFGRLRRSAVAAIQASQVPVQAYPSVWGQPLFPEALQEQVLIKPPRTISREEAMRDRELRRRNEYLYHQEKGIFRGQPLESGAVSEVRWVAGRLHTTTPKGSGAYAASVLLTYPSEGEQLLRLEVEVTCEEGNLGVGLLDEASNTWIDRAFIEVGTSQTVILEALVTGQRLQLVIHNGGDDYPARGIIGSARIRVEGIGQSLPVEWETLTIHNSPDALDDGTNPLNRHPRFACKAVYYNLYINEFFFRVNPCCYLQRVPGFNEVRLDGDMTFMEAWNSPGMVELRRRLAEGPLYAACKRCPEKW